MESLRVKYSVPIKKLIVLFSYDVHMSSLDCSSQNFLTFLF